MSKLNQNWLTENHIDFEYKKYILLAYLDEVSRNFDRYMLYPYLAELVGHFRHLQAIRENKKQLMNAFPGTLKKFDLEKFRLIYDKIIEDDSLMSEIEAIVDFSLPRFQHYLREGKKIYDMIEEQMAIHPVGLTPLHTAEGYLLLKDGKNAETQVYEYTITLFEQPDEKFRGISTQFVNSYKPGLLNTYDNIKKDLIANHRKHPNPATYVVETESPVPLDETFLPIAKRLLVKYIAA